MIQVSEINEQRRPSQKAPKKSGSTIFKMLANRDALKRMRVMGPDEPHYARPPRLYDLPTYRHGMQYCKSNEKYLRPTRWCNPRESLVIAVANELGANELSDREFAEAAYWYVKANMQLEMLPLDRVSATLERGTGTCYHLTSVWIALCRAAGIKARYRTFNLKLGEASPIADMPGVEMFNTGSTREAEGDVYVDGEWMTAHVASTVAMVASRGKRIRRLGESMEGYHRLSVPGSIGCFESLPLKFGIMLKAVTSWLAPAAMERVNIYFSSTHSEGRKRIEEAGGIEAYDQNIRRVGGLSPAEDIISDLMAERKQRITI